MQNIFIYGDKFTNTRRIADLVAVQTGFPIVTDTDMISLAGMDYDIPSQKIRNALEGKFTTADLFSREPKRALASLKATIATHFFQSPGVYVGLGGHLLPDDMPQLLKVFVTATADYRARVAAEAESLNLGQALKAVSKKDKQSFRVCSRIYDEEGFASASYDMVLPMDLIDEDQAADMIINRLAEEPKEISQAQRQALVDLNLVAKVEIALADKGCHAAAKAVDGTVRLMIDRNVLRLNKYAGKLKMLASSIEGVKGVEVSVGPHFYKTDIYRKAGFNLSEQSLFNMYRRRRRQMRKSAEQTLPADLRKPLRPVNENNVRPWASV